MLTLAGVLAGGTTVVKDLVLVSVVDEYIPIVASSVKPLELDIDVGVFGLEIIQQPLRQCVPVP